MANYIDKEKLCRNCQERFNIKRNTRRNLEMTDNDIIKALKCCGIINDCKGCYFDTHEAEDICAREIVKNAFDLINRQLEEIERLKKYNIEVAHKNYNDGIKEFAERLKENITKSINNYWNNDANGYYLAEDVLDEIDILVKEMICDTE